MPRKYGNAPSGWCWNSKGEHKTQRAAIRATAPKIGCADETLLQWVRRAERNPGQRLGSTTDERERIKAPEREVKELRRANKILRKASAFVAAAELDRPGR